MSIDPTRIDITTDPTNRRMIGYTAHKGMSFDVPFMSEVAENLWQGGCTDGLVLPKYIKHLVSLYPWEAYSVEHELETYMAVRMYDSLDQATDQILDIARWINSCRKTGPVLVHCQAGLNRSSLVAGTALVMNGEVTGRQAVKLLREKRSPACLCNQAFEDWLAGQKKPRNRKPSPQRLDLNADAAA